MTKVFEPLTPTARADTNIVTPTYHDPVFGARGRSKYVCSLWRNAKYRRRPACLFMESAGSIFGRYSRTKSGLEHARGRGKERKREEVDKKSTRTANVEEEEVGREWKEYMSLRFLCIDARANFTLPFQLYCSEKSISTSRRQGPQSLGWSHVLALTLPLVFSVGPCVCRDANTRQRRTASGTRGSRLGLVIGNNPLTWRSYGNWCRKSGWILGSQLIGRICYLDEKS